MSEPRPEVSVIVPFRGDGVAAVQVLARLQRLEIGEHDDVRVADNSDDGVLARIASPGIVTVRATRERSSYHARNTGARGAAGDWLLFLDADCVPDPGLIDAYFTEPVPAGCGALAGAIAGDVGQSTLVARYARDRNFLSQADGLHARSGVGAAAANLLVRRIAFEAIGGFAEGIRSGGDVDLCWRLRDAGWELRYRPEARVVHRHREGLIGFLRQVARYAAGARWLDTRHPGASPRWPLLGGLAGSVTDIASHLARGRIEQATFRAVDAVGLVAHNVGYLTSNRARRVR